MAIGWTWVSELRRRLPPIVPLIILWPRRYQQFKGALEKLDSKLAGNSSLPIVYQWEHQMGTSDLK